MAVTVVAALEAFGAGHGDGAHPAVAEVLLDFEDELGWSALTDEIDVSAS